MIPIISIANLISALFFGCVSLKTYFSYKKSKDEKMGDFFKTFLFLTILLFLILTPGLIFKNLKIISLIYVLYPFLGFLALANLGSVPLKIMGWQKTKLIFFRGMIIIAFLITLINFSNWQPAVVYQVVPFVYWQDTRGMLINNILGILYGLVLLITIIFFLIQSSRAKEKYLKIRSFFIVGGMASLIAMSVANFIFGASSQVFFNSLSAIFFNVLAAILLLIGIYYKPKTLS